MSTWLLPTALYTVALGVVGVTSKVALRALSWQELLIWTGASYVVVTAILLLYGTRLQLHTGVEGAMAASTAVIAPVAMLLLFVALNAGGAARVIPITSAYPIVTVGLAAVFLKEPVTLMALGGVVLVVAGVALLTIP